MRTKLAVTKLEFFGVSFTTLGTFIAIAFETELSVFAPFRATILTMTALPENRPLFGTGYL